MSEQKQPGPSADAVEKILRKEMMHGDTILATARPILRHLLANIEHAMFSDEVIATIRGMMLGLAREMLFVHAKLAGAEDREAFVDERQDDLAMALLEDGTFLSHAHAITIEAHMAQRLSERSGIDTVLSPLLQELAASSEPVRATEAMHTLSAQARFMQQQRRMELPLGELPQDLFDRSLELFEQCAGENAPHVETAQRAMRGDYDPASRRVARLVRLVASLKNDAKRALEVDHAGLSIFVTALGMASDQRRDTVILSLGENHCARLALSLRAAGLGQAAVEEQFLFLHPELSLPEGFENIRTDRAATLLADAQAERLN